MRRIPLTAREDWQAKVEAQGFPFHSGGLRPQGGVGTFWNETAYYEFTLPETDVLQAATEELHQRCLDVVEHVCKNPALLDRLGIPAQYHEFIVSSWRRRDPSVYGRFDLAFDGKEPPKLLEYNGDTPTTLIETSLIQYFWLEDIFGGFKKAGCPDQFN